MWIQGEAGVGQALGNPAADVLGVGRRVDVVGEGQPAAGVGEGGEPPGGGLVAGAVDIVVEGDEDAGCGSQAGDPLGAAPAGGGTGGHGGDVRAAGLDDGEGVEFAFDEDDWLGGGKAVGVVEAVGETSRPEVLGLPPATCAALTGRRTLRRQTAPSLYHGMVMPRGTWMRWAGSAGAGRPHSACGSARCWGL